MTDQTPGHQERAHADLSASGSSKWLNCTGSLKAERPYPNTTSIYAIEGTRAHEVADLCLTNDVDAEEYIGEEILGEIIDKEMAEYVQQYLDYVRSFIENEQCILYAEERVDFSNIADDGFGTLDSSVINFKERVCNIFDLKYGKGNFVSAVDNTQGQMYALGFLNELDFMGEDLGFDKFVIHIVQPRLNNFSQWEISVEDLRKFGEYAKSQARIAMSEDAPRTAGEKQCQWCRAKHDCPELMRHTNEIVSGLFDDLDHDSEEVKSKMDVSKLTDEQKKLILDNKNLVEMFIKAVEKSAEKSLKDGNKFPGYKLVLSKPNRKWLEDEAEKRLKAKLGVKKIYKKSLIGITDATKLLGNNKEAKEFVDKLTYRSEGIPVMAKESDKREEYNPNSEVDEFEDLDDDDVESL